MEETNFGKVRVGMKVLGPNGRLLTVKKSSTNGRKYVEYMNKRTKKRTKNNLTSAKKVRSPKRSPKRSAKRSPKKSRSSSMAKMSMAKLRELAVANGVDVLSHSKRAEGKKPKMVGRETLLKRMRDASVSAFVPEQKGFLSILFSGNDESPVDESPALKASKARLAAQKHKKPKALSKMSLTELRRTAEAVGIDVYSHAKRSDGKKPKMVSRETLLKRFRDAEKGAPASRTYGNVPLSQQGNRDDDGWLRDDLSEPDSDSDDDEPSIVDITPPEQPKPKPRVNKNVPLSQQKADDDDIFTMVFGRR